MSRRNAVRSCTDISSIMPVMDERTQMKLDLPVMLTAHDVCRMFQVSLETLKRMEDEWGFPVHRLGTGPKAPRRYELEAVLIWFRSRCSVNHGDAA